MLYARIVLDDVPEYIFKACGAETQDERDTISACVRTYARDCIQATLFTIEDGQDRCQHHRQARKQERQHREKWVRKEHGYS